MPSLWGSFKAQGIPGFVAATGALFASEQSFFAGYRKAAEMCLEQDLTVEPNSFFERLITYVGMGLFGALSYTLSHYACSLAFSKEAAEKTPSKAP
jgi:hypothetical protein